MAAHRFWRLFGTAAAGGRGFGMTELQFRTAPGVPLLFGAGAASAESAYQGTPGPYDASKAADNDPSTFYASNDGSGSQWWQWDYGAGAGLDVAEVAITARNDGYFNDAPGSFSLQYSDDGAAWTTRQSYVAAAWTQGGTQTFAVAGHRFWRINIHSNFYPNGYPSLAEVAFAAAPGGPTLIGGGAPIASGEYSANNVKAYACDGNLDTFWCPGQGMGWWGYDFGPSGNVAVAETRIAARHDPGDSFGSGASTSPAGWGLEWSDDGTAWTTQQSYTSAAWSDGSTQAFAVPVQGQVPPAVPPPPAPLRVTQAGAEVWGSSAGVGLRTTQAGAEAWGAGTSPQLRASQTGAEAWGAVAAPPLRVSQGGAEAWGASLQPLLRTTQAGAEAWIDLSTPFIARSRPPGGPMVSLIV